MRQVVILMVDRETVINTLKQCYDPEIPINIWDLGLIYDVQTSDDKVHVKMTLTAPGCPMHGLITEDVKAKLLQIDGIKDATVEIVWDPPWTPDRMSPEARKRFGLA